MSKFDAEVERIEGFLVPFHHRKGKEALDYWLNNWDTFEQLIEEHAVEAYQKEISTPSIFNNPQPSKEESVLKYKGFCLIQFSILAAKIAEGLLIDKADFQKTFMVRLPDEESKPLWDALLIAVRIFELVRADPYKSVLDDPTIDLTGGSAFRTYTLFINAAIKEVSGNYDGAITFYQKVVRTLPGDPFHHNPENYGIIRGIGDRARGRIVLLQEMDLLPYDTPRFIKKFRQILSDNEWTIKSVDENLGILVMDVNLNEGQSQNTLTIRFDADTNEAVFILFSNFMNDNSDLAKSLSLLFLGRNVYSRYGAWTILDPDKTPSHIGLIERLPMTLSTPQTVIQVVNDLCIECRDVTAEILKIIANSTHG